MVDMATRVTGISSPDPYDQLVINFTVDVDGTSSGWSGDCYVDRSDTEEEINDAIRAAAVTVAGNHSVTVGANDAKHVIGGVVLRGAATEAYADTGDAGRCAVPGASSTVSLSSGTPRQPSTTRPTLVMVSGSWSWNLTAVGTQTGSLTAKSDSSATPSTVIRAPAWSRGIGVGVSINDTGTMPIEFDLFVPASHYYSVTAAGGATFSIREQVL